MHRIYLEILYFALKRSVCVIYAAKSSRAYS